MSDFTDADRERMSKWCERPDGSVPYNAICRLFDSHDALRARLSAAESRLREYEDAPVVAWMWEYMGTHFSEGANRPEFLPHDPSYKTKQLIIRPRGGKGE